MRRGIPWIMCLGAFAAGAAEPQFQRFEYAGREMAADVRIVLYAASEVVADEAAKAAFLRIRELNAALSDYDPESELSRLCAAAVEKEVPVSEDLFRVLARAQEISRVSGGAFDVTVGPAVRLWRRARRLCELPDAALVEEARKLVGRELVALFPERRGVRLAKPGMRLDLGGIAKGYAADRALARLREFGVASALLDVGGDIALGAAPPGSEGWTVEVARHPRESGPPLRIVLQNAGVATSGDSEQHVVLQGRRYSHIVDPRTGLGLTDESCATVVAPEGASADALASAASVLGAEGALALAEKLPGVAVRVARREGDSAAVRESRSFGALARAPAAPSPAGQPPAALPAIAAGLPVPVAPPGALEVLAAGPAAALLASLETGGEPEGAGLKLEGPTWAPPVAWMLAPVVLPDAEAKSEAEMKPYCERIPGTEVTFEMVPIRGGKFLMGSPPEEPKRKPDEGPQHEVEVEPFWMGRCEVTWDEYELWGLGYDAARELPAGAELGPHDRLADAVTRPTKPYSDMTFGMGRKGYPAICMSQLAAKMYCKWLSAKTGRYYRLPTEAEWEYACRAGTTTAYSFGDDPAQLGDYAWHYGNSGERYHEVGKKKPNPWGLHDMHGNVAEWTLDAYREKGYESFAGKVSRNPVVVPEELHPRVARGGSWTDEPDALRSATRRASSRDWNMGDPQMPQSPWYLTNGTFVGFRVVRPLRVPAVEEAARYDLDSAQRDELANYLEYLSGRE